jgi:hypothetical protein
MWDKINIHQPSTSMDIYLENIYSWILKKKRITKMSHPMWGGFLVFVITIGWKNQIIIGFIFKISKSHSYWVHVFEKNSKS